nr:olfactory receptor 172 [Microplitis mediator]
MYIEPATVIRILMIFGKLTSTWPPDPNSNKFSKMAKEFLWTIFFLNVIGLLIPLFLGAYYNRREIILMMKSLSELTALGDVFFNLLLCKIQRRQLFALLKEIADYVKTIKGNEKVVFRKYVSRYFPFCTFVGLSYFQTAIAFSCGPLFMKQILPADTWYPFGIKPFTTRHYIIYIQQILAILQTGMGITVDFMVALLLSYSSTKLELLSNKLQDVKNNEELKICIYEHQNCIRFVRQLCQSVKFIILKSNATMAMAVIFGAIPLIYRQPLPVLSQFILMVFGGCLRTVHKCLAG